MSDPQVVLIYQHFYPDYSAGGPVTSIANLAQGLHGKLPVRIIASNRVYSTGQPMTDVKADTWTTWNDIPVWYASNRPALKRAIDSLPAGSVVYLNGIFLLDYFLYALRVARSAGHRIVISPRGMLQRGALEGGSLKKRFFLKILNKFVLSGKEVWHATDKEEREDILKQITRHGDVITIGNVPRRPAQAQVRLSKIKGELKVVYYSLISAKKNLKFLIDLLGGPGLAEVRLDIAGPVKDDGYWQSCLAAIATLSHPSRVKYIGEVSPLAVNELLSQYHVMALPTKGENFGHAIAEALSSFRPVLISNNTPWKGLEQFDAGYALPLDQVKWTAALLQMKNWDQQAFDASAAGAMKYFNVNINADNLLHPYIQMFQQAKG